MINEAYVTARVARVQLSREIWYYYRQGISVSDRSRHGSRRSTMPWSVFQGSLLREVHPEVGHQRRMTLTPTKCHLWSLSVPYHDSMSEPDGLDVV